MVNLLVNASHAIKEKGQITIKTWKDADSVFISISDTGSGISEKNMKHLFTPFFTTKKVGVGTGLGLSISKKIIDKHGGVIGVESEVGSGTTFTIKLPLVWEDQETKQETNHV